MTVTLHRGWKLQSDKKIVLEFLQTHEGTEFNAKAVLTGLGWSKNKLSSVRQYLKRLADEGTILRPHRGFYVCLREKAPKPTLKEALHREKVELHNLRLVSPNVTELEAYPLLDTKLQSDNIRDKIRSMFQQTSIDIWEHIGNKDVHSTVWEGRTLRIERSSVIEISLKAGDNPLDEFEMYGFEQFLCGYFRPINFKAIPWRIPYIELNIDLHHVTLTPQMITLQDYEGVYQRFYQKGESLRRENRIKTDTTLEEVIANLKGDVQTGTVGLHDKIDVLVEAIREHLKEHRRMEAWIEKLIEKNVEEKELAVKFGR